MGTPKEKHLQALEYVFHKCREKSITLNPMKCIFGVEYGILLGFLISKHGIAMDPFKVEALIQTHALHIVRQLRGFLGAVKHYNHFIKDMAHLILPLNTLLRVDTTFHWVDSQQTSFDRLKDAFTKAPTMKPPADATKPFHLYTSYFLIMSFILSSPKI